MEDKFYYLNEKIGPSGVAGTRNPIYMTEKYEPFKISARRTNVGDIVTPTSKYDETLGNLDDVIYGDTTVEDLRAEQQSGLEMIGNSLANNVVIAGSTAISGTLGLVDGIFSALSSGEAQDVWDNRTTNWATNIQERTREVLPIYRGKEYEDKTLFQKLGTGIFWADLVQNLGFSEGMLLQGAGMAKILSSAPSMVRALVPSLTASIGEASIEAINARNDEELNKVRIANSEYNRMAQNAKSPFALGVLDSEYNKTLDSIEHDSNTAGNFVFGSNVALLTMSNAIQFGNLFSRGFGTAKRLNGALKRTGNVYSTDNMTLAMLGAGAKKLAQATSEGIEEVSQHIAATTPSNYTDYNTFNASIFNPEKRELVANIWQAIGQGYSQAMQDKETGVEFASGFLIGALGIPTIRKSKFPIGIENNIGVELYETYKNIQNQRELADRINNRLQEDKKINSYYNGLVRHLAIQDRMNTALDNEDAFDYKNAEAAQFISDIMMFDEAGDIENLRSIINNSVDMSDEGIDAIIRETSVDGKGPFMFNGNPLTRDEVRDILSEKIGILNGKLNSYIKNKAYLESNFPNMDNETLNNALFLREQFNDHSYRYEELLEKAYQGINKLLTPIPQEVSKGKIKDGEGIDVTDSEGKRRHVRKSDIDYFDENGNAVMKETKSPITEKFNISKNKLVALLHNPVFIEFINQNLADDSSSMSYDEKSGLKSTIEDLLKLEDSIIKINKSLKEILTNPSKSAKDLQRTRENAVAADTQSKAKSLREKLLETTSLKDFRSVIDNDESDAQVKNEAIESLANEGNEVAKNYKEVNTYNAAVRRAINSLDETTDVKNNALTLFNLQYENAENLQDIANPNSVYVDDHLALYDDTLTEGENIKKQQEAMYALLTAMKNVNNDARFKSRFSTEYTDIQIKGKPNPNAPGSETTGDSKTATVPDAGTEALPDSSAEEPTGNITAEMMAEENAGLNNRTEEIPSGEVRQYYRPAIPQIHIEASRDGDFRPFNAVVKEREAGVDFDVIYDYLRDNGAFDYVNNGNLKVGDVVKFKIDPTFEESMKNAYSWYKGPTIFMTTESGQVIGSLDAGASVAKFEGLSKLEQRIVEEYNTTGEITVTTNISKIMIGKIPYTKEERSLASIPGVTGDGISPVFGIVKNGTLTTNGKLNDSQIINPSDMANKEGRMYLLIPNAAGKYSPVAVRVKHFNETEFNLNDVVVANTPIGKSIREAITNLASATSQEDVSSAVKSLEQDLYFRDVMVTWFSANAGDGIVISRKIRKPNGSYEKVIINGKEYIKEEKHTVYFTTSKKNAEIGGIVYDAAALADLGYTENLGTPKDPSQIQSEILDIITKFNLPLQVSAKRINKGNYNKAIVNSNIVTSNISSAEVLGSWFTTDYIDESGVQQRATNPERHGVRQGNYNPVGGTESAIKGTSITIGDTTVYVDLEEMVIRDANGKSRGITSSDTLLVDLAWAQNIYGDATTGDKMWNNKVVTPEGRVLDRTTKKHLTGDAAQEVIDRVNGVLVTTPDAKRIVAQIDENQKKVDKERTDGDYYYVLEDDGQYHQYERVHTRLGGNWIMSKKQEDALQDIQVKLSRLVGNASQYKNYIKYLGSYYKVDLSQYESSTDTKSRMDIVTVIRDAMSGTRSKRALDAGSAVDTVIRNFFNSTNTPSRPANMSEEAFNSLVAKLTEIKSAIEARGEKFITNNVVLYQKYADGTRVAGEVDILSVDKDGNFRIYDVKTSRYSFYDFTDNRGATVNYFRNKSRTQKMSNLEYYTLQLSAYKNLFESQYGAPVKSLGILPFVLGYDGDNVASVTKEKGISIAYNPAVNVPKASEVRVPKVNPTTDTINEIKDPINTVLPEYKMSDSQIGYFILKGEVHRGYISPVGNIEGVEIKVTKVPNITSGYGKDEAHVAFNSYHVVFPNGNTFEIIPSDNGQMSEQQVKEAIMNVLSKNPTRVKQMASETTVLSSQNMNQQQSGAFKAKESERGADAIPEEFDDDLDLANYREVDSDRPTWNREKELAWIKKVLPQLNEADAIKVVNGLIEVAGKGTYAWGKFSNGIVTLSDTAAEGTTYHEAFHVVFNLMLSNSERQALYNEARTLYGNKSELELEESMAEGFREYVMNRDSRSLGQKILDFFKNLLAKITNWKYIKPSLTSYYRMINEGKYSKDSIKSLSFESTKIEEVKVDNEQWKTLSSKGWTKEKWNSISERERQKALECLHI